MNKRFFSIIMLVVMCMFVVEGTVIKVYANNVENVNAESGINYFEESKENYEYTQKKIEEEKKHNLNVMSNDLEEYLNDNGIFDDEIAIIEEDVIRDLESVKNMDDIQIQTEFYELIDVSSLDSESQQVNQYDANICKELNENEINEVIAEVYYNKKNDENKEKQSLVDKTLESIGIKPVNAYASTRNSEENHSDYMKKQIIVFPVTYNNKQFYRIYFSCHWIIAPKNRMVDTVCLNWDSDAAYFEYIDSKNQNIMRNNTNANIYYVYNIEEWSRVTGKCVNSVCHNKTIDFKTNEDYYVLPTNNTNIPLDYYSTSSSGMSVSFDLMDDVYLSSTNTTSTYSVVDEIFVTMNVYVKKSNEDKSVLKIEGEYWHQQKETECKIKYTQISFGPKGNTIMSLAMFVYENLHCVKLTNYSKSVGGGNLPLNYEFK